MDGAQISGNRTSARSPSGCRADDCASYPLRGLRGPGQRWGCSHAVIKDHPPRRNRRLEQPACSGGPAHKDPDRAGTRNPRDYRVPRSRIHPAGRWRGRPRLPVWPRPAKVGVAEQLTGVSPAVVDAAASPHRRREASDHSS